jgi:hypothetical protein
MDKDDKQFSVPDNVVVRFSAMMTTVSGKTKVNTWTETITLAEFNEKYHTAPPEGE